jgi:hypothetical protein
VIYEIQSFRPPSKPNTFGLNSDKEFMRRTWALTPIWRQNMVIKLGEHFPHWRCHGKPFLSWIWIDTADEHEAEVRTAAPHPAALIPAIASRHPRHVCEAHGTNAPPTNGRLRFWPPRLRVARSVGASRGTRSPQSFASAFATSSRTSPSPSRALHADVADPEAFAFCH